MLFTLAELTFSGILKADYQDILDNLPSGETDPDPWETFVQFHADNAKRVIIRNITSEEYDLIAVIGSTVDPEIIADITTAEMKLTIAGMIRARKALLDDGYESTSVLDGSTTKEQHNNSAFNLEREAMVLIRRHYNVKYCG